MAPVIKILIYIKYILKAFFIHFTIILFYLGITSYYFVIRKSIEPIATGLQQDLLMLFHLISSVIVAVKGKAMIKQKYLINLLCVLSLIIIYFIFNYPIWNWLWSLR